MTERWQQIERIFEEMLLLAEPLRQARLLELTANDPGLRREVESLLAQQPAESGFLETPVALAQDLRRTLLGDFLLGKQFGSYRVDSLIGEGGMGLVFRATDTRSAHPVALKILPPEAARHSERNKQFDREKRALEKLQHPAIVRLLDFGTDGGFAYLVMEYVEGRTLRDVLAGLAPESLGTQSLIDQFVSALAAVHGAGLVHGDLKPDNLMITDSGQLKLVDFGLATQVSPVSMRATVAELGLAGTIGYSAPERIRGDSASPASDVFAAGAVLFEILTGRPLFEGKTPWAVAERILEGRPNLSAAPASWRKVLGACLAANPATRIQDGVALASSLRGTPGSTPAWKRFRAPAAAVGTVLAVAACCYWWRTSPQLPASLVLGDHVSPRIAVSPDGKWVAYSQRDPANQTQAHIFLRSTAGGGATQLTTGPYRDSLPSFADNGRRLLFESNRSPEGIYMVTIGPAAVPKLAIAGGHAPRASPDGKWLVYFLSRLGSGDSHATAPGVALASLSEGFPRMWLNTEFIPLGPGIWRQDSSSFTLRAASATSSTPEGRTFSATFGVRSNAGTRSQDGFRELCGWAGPGTLLGLSGLTGISAAQTDPHRVPSVPPLLNETPQLESCVVQRDNVFGVQSIRQTAFLAATLAPDSELDPNGFQLDPRFVGATSPSLSLDGRWAAFNAEARNGQPFRECLFDFHSGRDFIINTVQGSLGTPKLSPSGKVVLVLESEASTRYGIRSVHSMAPIGVELPVEATAWDISEEGQVILTASSTSPRSIRANRPSTAAVWTVVSSPRHNLYLARISPDEKWLVFTAEDTGDHKPVLYAAPYHVGRGTALSEWVRLGSGDYPAWSASGSAVYYLDESLPLAELKRIALDPRTKQPLGPSVTVHRFGGEWRPSGLLPGTFRIAASRERVLVTVGRYEMTLLRAN